MFSSLHGANEIHLLAVNINSKNTLCCDWIIDDKKNNLKYTEMRGDQQTGWKCMK